MCRTAWMRCSGFRAGLVGLRGAGHGEIGRALFGMARFTGTVLLDGAEPDLTSPCIAMISGVGFVARDRVVESVAPALTIRENTFLDPSASGRKPVSFMAPRAENALASNLGSRVGLTPNDPTLPIEALSGGNQQKVATLGTGTVLYAIALWHTGGRQVVGALDPNFYRLSGKWVLGLPITGF